MPPGASRVVPGVQRPLQKRGGVATPEQFADHARFTFGVETARMIRSGPRSHLKRTEPAVPHSGLPMRTIVGTEEV